VLSFHTVLNFLLETFVPVRWIKVTDLCNQKRRYAHGLVERKYCGFVSVNLNPSLPQRKLYQNLFGLGIVNAPEKLQVEMGIVNAYEKLQVEMNNYFLTRSLLNEAQSGLAIVAMRQLPRGFFFENSGLFFRKRHI
jgi:hypothetical protein